MFNNDLSFLLNKTSTYTVSYSLFCLKNHDIFYKELFKQTHFPNKKKSDKAIGRCRPCSAEKSNLFIISFRKPLLTKVQKQCLFCRRLYELQA